MDITGRGRGCASRDFPIALKKRVDEATLRIAGMMLHEAKSWFIELLEMSRRSDCHETDRS
jgi:hypothetical protein